MYTDSGTKNIILQYTLLHMNHNPHMPCFHQDAMRDSKSPYYEYTVAKQNTTNI